MGSGELPDAYPPSSQAGRLEGMSATEQRTAPIVYFFAGIEGDAPERIPEPWRQRFFLDGKAPNPNYPQAREFPGGATTRHLDAGPGGRPGLIAAPYTMSVEMWGPSLQYPWDSDPLAEVEVDADVWVLISSKFTPFDIMRSPVVAPLDIERVKAVATRHTPPQHRWVVPCCLPGHPECCLPMVDHYERGAWREVPRHEYAPIAHAAQAIVAGQTGSGPVPDREQIRRFCCDAIALNYEITEIELAALGILSDDFYNAVASLLIGREAKIG